MSTIDYTGKNTNTIQSSIPHLYIILYLYTWTFLSYPLSIFVKKDVPACIANLGYFKEFNDLSKIHFFCGNEKEGNDIILWCGVIKNLLAYAIISHFRSHSHDVSSLKNVGIIFRYEERNIWVARWYLLWLT